MMKHGVHSQNQSIIFQIYSNLFKILYYYKIDFDVKRPSSVSEKKKYAVRSVCAAKFFAELLLCLFQIFLTFLLLFFFVRK